MDLTAIKEFIVSNWAAIVAWFDKLWALAKATILKDDSIWAGITEAE